jgi:conjugal transfer/type IV secretion protein DotA/TraY
MSGSTADFFVPQNGDWAAEAIETLFETDGVLSTAIGLYNFIFASIGGVVLLWLLIRVVMETGQHGSIAGKNSEIWFPIRFVVTVGLLAPLPPVGLNSAEYVVIGVAKMGVAAGSKVWDTAVEYNAKMKPLVVPVTPEVRDLAGGLFMIEVCREVQRLSAQATGGTTIQEVDASDRSFQRYSYDGTSAAGGVRGQCGAVAFERGVEKSDVSTSSGAVKILKAHAEAARTLQAALAPAAKQLADQLLPPFSSGKPSGPSIDITSLMRTYTAKVMAAAGEEVATGNSRLEKYEASATAGGWVRAGAWGISLMQANQVLIEAVNNVPEVSAPRYDWWSGEVYQTERAAMQAAAQWWAETYAQKATTDWDAYNATANTNSAYKLTSIFDVARYKYIYDTFLLSGSENPLSEMTSLGHTIIDAVWISAVSYSTLRAAAAATDGAKTTIIGKIVNKVAPVSAVAKGVGEFLAAMAPIFWVLVFSLLGAGIMMAYALPLTPALIWMYAVARYFMRIFLTVIGANVWALAHLELEGEGLGHRASHGYVFLLDLLIRPMIMTLSLVGGYAALWLFGQLFAMTYFEAIRNTITGHHAGITGLVTYTVIGAMALMTLCHIAMQGVSEGCDYVLGMATWHLGTGGAAAGADEQQTSQKVGAGAHQAQQAIQGGVGKPGHSAGGMGGVENGNPGASPGHSMQNSLPGEIGRPRE